MRTLLFLTMLFPACAFGQDSLNVEPTPPPVVSVAPRAISGPILKLAPLSAFDLDPTIQGAIEVPLRPKLSVQQEIGYGSPRLNTGYQKGEFIQQKSTFRSRTEIRYYISPGLSKQAQSRVGPGGLYVSGEFLYKKMTAQATRGRSTEVLPYISVPSVINTDTKANRHVYGLHAKIGYQGVLSAKTPRLIVDVYVGVGFRVISVRQVSDPIRNDILPLKPTGLSRFEPFNSALIRPSLAGGIKIGWLITTEKKKNKK